MILSIFELIPIPDYMPNDTNITGIILHCRMVSAAVRDDNWH